METAKKLGRRDDSSRKYLTEKEVERLLKACAKFKGEDRRNKLMIWMMFCLGYRVSELIQAQWSDVLWDRAKIYVRRVKNSVSCELPIFDHKLYKELRSYYLELKRNDKLNRFIFTSYLDAPLSRAYVHKVVRKAAEFAGFDQNIHPHMLRHACGFYHADKNVNTRHIQVILGHKCIRNTEIYTQLSATALEQYRR